MSRRNPDLVPLWRGELLFDSAASWVNRNWEFIFHVGLGWAIGFTVVIFAGLTDG